MWGKESAVGVRLLREGILKVVWRRSAENRRVPGPARHRPGRVARRDERSCGAGGARAPAGQAGSGRRRNGAGGARLCGAVCLFTRWLRAVGLFNLLPLGAFGPKACPRGTCCRGSCRVLLLLLLLFAAVVWHLLREASLGWGRWHLPNRAPAPTCQRSSGAGAPSPGLGRCVCSPGPPARQGSSRTDISPLAAAARQRKHPPLVPGEASAGQS